MVLNMTLSHRASRRKLDLLRIINQTTVLTAQVTLIKVTVTAQIFITSQCLRMH